LVEGLSLGEHQHKPLYMLSTGSKRKVWLAAAFAAGAPVTLLDVPFASLDKASIRFVTEQLCQQAKVATRAWVFADYEAPSGLPFVSTLDLGD
jgi:energy-coupling factor transporter ATP-binding protein EcfA2